MPRRPSVPDELRQGPFRGAEAVRQGVLTREQLRSRCWARLLRGVYVHADTPLTQDTRSKALRLVVDERCVVAGRTAAWWHGAWQPPRGVPVPLEVTRPVGSSSSAMRGLGRRRLTLRGSEDWRGGTSGVSSLDRDVVRLDGMQVLSPLRTCFDMMRERGLVEAVVVADAFAFQGVVDPVTMAVYAADRRRWPGVRLARTALNLSHPGARSPGESRLRMVVVLAGMPEPLVNVPVYDVSDHVLGVPDLTIHGRRQVGLEYDGAYHEQDDQQAADRRRENSLTALAGLPLLRYDRISVAQVAQRCLAAQEIARLAGTVVRNELVTADFVRPPRHLAWSL